MDLERRKHVRTPCGGVVSLTMKSGEFRGATFAGILVDISEGGICLVLDGGVFSRGTEVELEFQDGLRLPAWACHCRSMDGLTTIGLSFTVVEDLSPHDCFNQLNCATAAPSKRDGS